MVQPRRNRHISDAVDMYRRVPSDLTEGTNSGSILSYMAVFVMLLLFMLETRDYMQKRYVQHFEIEWCVCVCVCDLLTSCVWWISHSFSN